MTKYLLIMALLVFSFGCAEPKVKIVENSISGDISIDGVRERMSGQLKEIEVYGDNDSGDYMKFRYRVVWSDKDGFEITSMSSQWTDFSVYKNTPFSFKSIAPSINAVDFKVYINK